MVKSSTRLSRTIFILAIVWLSHWSSVLAQDEASIIKIGDPLPSFKVESSNGLIHSSDLKGKVVMINFFATWCPPCIKELPYVEKRIWTKHKNNPNFKLMVVGRNHTQEEMDKFQAKKFDLPYYPDKDREMYSKFALNTIPRNYIINKAGKIIYASTGFSLHEFEKMLAILEKELSS